MKNTLRPKLGLAVAATTGALLATMMPAPAGAWGVTTPVQVSAGGTSLTVSGNDAGAAAAAWVSGGQVYVSQKSVAANVWSTPAQVSDPTQTASLPDVSVGAAGDVALVWVSTPAGGGESEVWLAQQAVGAAWVGARMLSDPAVPGDNAPQVDIGSAGNATTVWTSTNGGSAVIRARTADTATLGGGTSFGATAGVTFDGLALARAGNGDALIAWRAVAPGNTAFTLKVARRAAGVWTAKDLGTSAAVDHPSVTMDANGNGWIGWAGGAAESAMSPAFALWVFGKDVSAPTSLGGTGVRQVQVVANRSGQLVASWISPAGLQFSDIRSGTPSTATVVPGAVETQSLAYSDTGAATVAFARPGSGNTLNIAHRPHGDPWTSQELPSAAGARPVAVAQAANALVTWGDAAGGPVYARIVDSRAPTAVHLTAPLRPFNTSNEVAVGWIGSDPSSTINYEVYRSVATSRSAPGPMELWQTTTATSGRYAAAEGQTVCFQVRGIDAGGNASAMSVPRCTTTPINALKAKKIRKKKVWKKGKSAGYFRNNYLETRRQGAQLKSKRVTGNRFAILVATSKNAGKIKVKLGNTTLGEFSLKSRGGKGWRKGEIIQLASYPAVKSGKLKITVTSKKKPVRIDAIYAGTQ